MSHPTLADLYAIAERYAGSPHREAVRARILRELSWLVSGEEYDAAVRRVDELMGGA